MNWHEANYYQRLEEVKILLAQGLTQAQIGARVSACTTTIRLFCKKHNLVGRSQGAQPRNQNAIIHGHGRNTIMRLAQRVVKEDGRDLRICECCGLKDPLENHPIHHKDRDRSNNTPSNLEVLCRTCHNDAHKNERPRGEDGQYI